VKSISADERRNPSFQPGGAFALLFQQIFDGQAAGIRGFYVMGKPAETSSPGKTWVRTARQKPRANFQAPKTGTRPGIRLAGSAHWNNREPYGQLALPIRISCPE
jgi:hypothetical protein